MQEYSVRHVAIIPDGNRRWAKAQGKASWAGHEEGVKVFEKILRKAHEMNVHCISFWGMSTDNMTKREAAEVAVLLRLFETAIDQALSNPEFEKNDVRISIIGAWREKFPARLVQKFEKTIEASKNRTKHVLNLMLCYDGKSEMQQAFAKAHEAKDSEDIKKFLWTRDLPPVDLVIRTAGDPHLSAGFMMWDTADAQLHFSEKLWPDFTPEDFEAALADFHSRERRFGA